MKKQWWGGFKTIEVPPAGADGISRVTIGVDRVDWSISFVSDEGFPIVYGEHKPLNYGKCTCSMSVLCLTGCQCGGK